VHNPTASSPWDYAAATCCLLFHLPTPLLLFVQEVALTDLKALSREQVESGMTWAGFAILSVSRE
jgi:hypothetical protein